MKCLIAVAIACICGLSAGYFIGASVNKSQLGKCEPKLIQFNADNTMNVICIIDVEQKHDTKKE